LRWNGHVAILAPRTPRTTFHLFAGQTGRINRNIDAAGHMAIQSLFFSATTGRVTDIANRITEAIAKKRRGADNPSF
jgi:hypothetical protein